MGVVYPTLMSAKAAKQQDEEAYFMWMTYWVIWAALSMLEYTLLEYSLKLSLPFFYELKSCLILWLVLPRFQGAAVLFDNYVLPWLIKYEDDIDERITKASTEVRRRGSSVLNKLANQLLQHASAFLVERTLGTKKEERELGDVLMDSAMRSVNDALGSLGPAREGEGDGDGDGDRDGDGEGGVRGPQEAPVSPEDEADASDDEGGFLDGDRIWDDEEGLLEEFRQLLRVGIHVEMRRNDHRRFRLRILQLQNGVLTWRSSQTLSSTPKGTLSVSAIRSVEATGTFEVTVTAEAELLVIKMTSEGDVGVMVSGLQLLVGEAQRLLESCVLQREAAAKRAFFEHWQGAVLGEQEPADGAQGASSRQDGERPLVAA